MLSFCLCILKMEISEYRTCPERSCDGPGLHSCPWLLTQSSIVDDGRHAGEQLAAGVAEQRARHSPACVVAAMELKGLLAGNRCGIPSNEHLHGRVSREQGDLHWEGVTCPMLMGRIKERKGERDQKRVSTYRVNQDTRVGDSAPAREVREFQPKGVAHSPFQADRPWQYYKPANTTAIQTCKMTERQTSIMIEDKTVT